MTTPEPEAQPQGQQLDGINLQEVLDSGANAADVGRQQFFTPRSLAGALMLPLPATRLTFVDWNMGAGSLLDASNSPFRLGVDIDPRCARKPDGAADEWHTATADITKLYPLLVDLGWRFDLGGFNPPFSVKWHNDRLAALAESDCPAVRETYRAGKEVVDSTLATAMMALDRLTEKGEFFLVCNQSTAERLFGPPDSADERHAMPGPLSECPLRKHIWLWITLPAGVFENVHHDFETAVLYFAKDHVGRRGPMHQVSTSPHGDDVYRLLMPWRHGRNQIRRGSSLWSPGEFDKSTVAHFEAAKDEYYTLYRGARTTGFNLWLQKGRIRRHLTPFQYSSRKIPKDLIAALNDLDGRTPIELVVQKETRLMLQRAVRSNFWRVDPKLVEAVDEAVVAYNANRSPFYPLSEVQRLGFLDESDSIQCKAALPGFTVGEFYPIACATASTERTGNRINIWGAEEDVTYHGQELVVRIQTAGGKKAEWHSFTTDPANTLGLVANLAHSMQVLVEHFHIPAVPDVSITHPERYAANLARIEEIEAAARDASRPTTPGRPGSSVHRLPSGSTATRALVTTGPNGPQGFSLRKYQRIDLARFAVHNGGILGWDPGLGKTLGIGFYPQIKGAKRVLIVAPDSLHQQIIDELLKLLGIQIHLLRSQDDFYTDRKLKAAALDIANRGDSDVEGWWITSYTQLGMNGADEWEDKIDDVTEQAFVTPKLMAMRQQLDRFSPADNFGCGLEKNGIRCLFRPTLATLTRDVFDCVEIDEGVRLKGDDSYISTGVRRMRPKYRAIMTGTPVKNRLDDIFWLAHWAAGGSEEASARWPYPNSVKAKNEFADAHMIKEQNNTKELESQVAGKARRYEKRTAKLTNVHRLWKLLSNVVIRRRKADIGEDIVPKTIVPITIPPGTSQQAVYSFHINNPPKFRKDGREMNAVAACVTQLQMLRQAALCPDSPNLSAERISLYQLKIVLQDELDPKSKLPPDTKATQRAVLAATLAERPGTPGEAMAALAAVERMLAGSAKVDLEAVYAAAPSLRGKLKAVLVPESTEPGRSPKNSRSWTDHNPKQTAILKLIEELLSKGEQVAIMSPFQHFSESLCRRLTEAGVSVCLLDGNTSASKRGQLSKQFKRFKFSVMIGGIQSMGEGHSWDQCSHLIMPSLEWAFDKNRQAEDRVHRLTSMKPVTIYTMVMANSIDLRLFSLYAEKSDSSSLALDGALFADHTEEVSLGELLSDAIQNFDTKAATIDELELDREWETSLRQKLRVAEVRFHEWHPPIATDADGTRVTPSQVKRAVMGAGLVAMVNIVKAVPCATFGALIGSRDAGVIAQCKREFIEFCEQGNFADWRRAWTAFDKVRDQAVTPAKAKATNALAKLLSL